VDHTNGGIDGLRGRSRSAGTAEEGDAGHERIAYVRDQPAGRTGAGAGLHNDRELLLKSMHEYLPGLP